MITTIRSFLAGLACAVVTTAAAAQSLDDVITTELREGWRAPDGTHVAALHLRLAPGWKTYWRAPGDGGIPPQLEWQGTTNLQSARIEWPTPRVFWQQGLRSVGYEREVILPLRLSPKTTGEAVTIRGALHIGLCLDICLPHSVFFEGSLPPKITSKDPAILAALLNVPLTRSEAQVSQVDCRFEPLQDGLALTATVTMPSAGGREEVIIETGSPKIWVADAKTERNGANLTAKTRLVHAEGRAFSVSRQDLRITVLGQNHAVDIQGCR